MDGNTDIDHHPISYYKEDTCSDFSEVVAFVERLGTHGARALTQKSGRIKLMPYSHDKLAQSLVLLGIILVNLWIMAGLFPNAIPTVETTQLIVLAAIELVVVLSIYRYAKRHSRQVSF